MQRQVSMDEKLAPQAEERREVGLSFSRQIFQALEFPVRNDAAANPTQVVKREIGEFWGLDFQR